VTFTPESILPGQQNGRRWGQRIRWLSAFVLLVAGAVAFLISNTTPHLHSCSIITDTSSIPDALRGGAEQGYLRLPVSVCQPVAPWSLLPFAALALLLLLPDFQEIGFGSFGLKRVAAQITERLDRVSQEVSQLAIATSITKDTDKGTVYKGKIRNVELRVPTVQAVLFGVLDGETGDPSTRLYRAGHAWGLGWSRDFLPIEQGVNYQTKEGVRRLLEDWSKYDATAGMGTLSFSYDESSGLPVEAKLANGFLSIEEDGVDLRYLFGGYIAGSLDGLLAPFKKSFTAVIKEKAVDLEVYELTAADE